MHGALWCGTSPRMRGKPNVRPWCLRWQRNIPAYAGKTRRRRRIPFHPAEHPRVCGENRGCLISLCAIGGTSPRMRGKRILFCIRACLHRNIPAYAGKTGGGPGVWWGFAEHPRVCGENLGFHILINGGVGTSPRMRGKLERAEVSPVSQRNIPAYAGKTSKTFLC